jgi:hypothetical protein
MNALSPAPYLNASGKHQLRDTFTRPPSATQPLRQRMA